MVFFRPRGFCGPEPGEEEEDMVEKRDQTRAWLENALKSYGLLGWDRIMQRCALLLSEFLSDVKPVLDNMEAVTAIMDQYLDRLYGSAMPDPSQFIPSLDIARKEFGLPCRGPYPPPSDIRDQWEQEDQKIVEEYIKTRAEKRETKRQLQVSHILNPAVLTGKMAEIKAMNAVPLPKKLRGKEQERVSAQDLKRAPETESGPKKRRHSDEQEGSDKDDNENIVEEASESMVCLIWRCTVESVCDLFRNVIRRRRRKGTAHGARGRKA